MPTGAASAAAAQRNESIGFSLAAGLAGFTVLLALSWDGLEGRGWAIIVGYTMANATLALLVAALRPPELRASAAILATAVTMAVLMVGILSIGPLLLPALVFWILSARRLLREPRARHSLPVVLMLLALGTVLWTAAFAIGT